MEKFKTFVKNHKTTIIITASAVATTGALALAGHYAIKNAVTEELLNAAKDAITDTGRNADEVIMEFYNKNLMAEITG